MGIRGTDQDQLLSIAILLMLLLLFLISCSNQQTANESEIVILAASSLTNAIEDLAAQFEEGHPGTRITLSLGSSSQLSAQILGGVPGDLFASANETQMEVVKNAGGLYGKVIIFATNSLVICVPQENPYQIGSIRDLTKPNLRLVTAVLNTPIRDYSDQIVENSLSPQSRIDFYKNIVSEEANVRQLITKIALGEADAGLVYQSDLTPDLKNLVVGIPIPQEANVVAQYPISVLKQSQNPDLAQEFIEFTLGEEGQMILQKWGFGTIP